MHPHFMLIDNALSDSFVIAKFTTERLLSSMLNDVQLKQLVACQPFVALCALKPKKAFVLVISMLGQHTSVGELELAHVTLEHAIRIVLHISML